MSFLFVDDDVDLRIPLVMTAGEYDALPEDFRAEIVNGVLQPMNRPTAYHQKVLSRLESTLEAVLPADLDILREAAVRFSVTPPHERHPDLVVVRRSGLDLFSSTLRPEQVARWSAPVRRPRTGFTSPPSTRPTASRSTGA